MFKLYACQISSRRDSKKGDKRHRSLDFVSLFLIRDLPVQVTSWFLASDGSEIQASVGNFRPINENLTSNIYYLLSDTLIKFSVFCIAKRSLICCILFKSPWKIAFLHGDVTITTAWLQNLGLCSGLITFEQNGIFYIPDLLWKGL